ncbi:acyl carrier protein [Deltaproteobacteria bacterium]|nr:acyl carrier protein [Deltaproteobacteria bacterium]
MSTIEQLQSVFRDVFEDDDIAISRTTTARDVAGWDSVMNVTLMISVERAFSLRFKSGNIAGLKNVGELVDLIDRLKASA